MAQTQPQGVRLSTKTIREQANRWLVQDVLGVSRLVVVPTPDPGNHIYICYDTHRNEITRVTMSDQMSVEKKFAVLRTAVRMSSHGHDH